MNDTTSLSPYCIYTIRRSADLDAIFRSGGQGKFTEIKNWVTGTALFQHAHQTGTFLPVVFAPGESCDALIYWAIITGMSIDDTGPNKTTTYTFTALQRIRGKPPLKSLRLKTGTQLSNDFRRPYAICHTPDFLAKSMRQPHHTASMKHIHEVLLRQFNRWQSRMDIARQPMPSV